jgi:hypothetical protein
MKKNKTHKLKTIQPYFDHVNNWSKDFELRKNDRNFKVGDELILQEYVNEKLTGKVISVRIKYILSNCPEFGLKEGYVILGLE